MGASAAWRLIGRGPVNSTLAELSGTVSRSVICLTWWAAFSDGQLQDYLAISKVTINEGIADKFLPVSLRSCGYRQRIARHSDGQG